MNHEKVASAYREIDHLRSNKQLGQVSIFQSGISNHWPITEKINILV